MNTLGELLLLGALVGSGYAAFACIVGHQRGHRGVSRSGEVSAVAGVLALSGVAGILARALLTKDFGFAYVAQYSSRLLPWHYSLSALWVGQSGSVLLWAWFSGVLAIAYRFWPRRQSNRLRQPAFGVLMACLCFLVAIMVFGADPMEASLGTPQDGAGLSLLLQHPAMLIHPPIVLLGYAGWAIPFALAVAGLASGRIDSSWLREARPWALFSWVVLGSGILWGAEWAYEELGWGGYWAWDPVENGSLVPWLTGTALIHTMMAWQYCGVLKKTTLSLAVATLGLCDFATFLTRSGVFSSLHAFGESPVGWMFLGLTAVVIAGGGLLVVLRRKGLVAGRPIPSVFSREASVLIATLALLLLAAVALVGTLVGPMSKIVLGRGVVVGTAFYNNVLIPTGLVLLATIAAAPLLRWGGAPRRPQRRALFVSAGAGGVAAALAWALSRRHPIELAVAWLAAGAVVALAGALLLDVLRPGSRRSPSGGRRTTRGLSQFSRRENGTVPLPNRQVICRPPPSSLWTTLRAGRRQYAGYLIHLGFVCLAVGVAGSSLGTRRREVVMGEGQTIEWAGYRVRCAKLIQRELPDKLVAEAQIEVSCRGSAPATLLPAQHLHRYQGEWTTEVAIDSTWRADFYVILRGGEGEGRVSLTLIENPMIRWMWLGGWIAGLGALIGLWPAKRRPPRQSVVPAPKLLVRSGRSQLAVQTNDG